MYCVNYSQEKRRKYSYICHDTPYLFTDSFSAIKDLSYGLSQQQELKRVHAGTLDRPVLGQKLKYFGLSQL